MAVCWFLVTPVHLLQWSWSETWIENKSR